MTAVTLHWSGWKTDEDRVRIESRYAALIDALSATPRIVAPARINGITRRGAYTHGLIDDPHEPAVTERGRLWRLGYRGPVAPVESIIGQQRVKESDRQKTVFRSYMLTPQEAAAARVMSFLTTHKDLMLVDRGVVDRLDPLAAWVLLWRLAKGEWPTALDGDTAAVIRRIEAAGYSVEKEKAS